MATPIPPPEAIDPVWQWIASGGAAAAVVGVLKVLDHLWTKYRGLDQSTWENASEVRTEWKETALYWKGEWKETRDMLDKSNAHYDAARLLAVDFQEKNKALVEKVIRYKARIETLGGEVSEAEDDETVDTGNLEITQAQRDALAKMEVK